MKINLGQMKSFTCLQLFIFSLFLSLSLSSFLIKKGLRK